MSRVAVVTGGASGIGLGICRHLSAAGHRVAVLDIDAEAAARTAEELNTGSRDAFRAQVDVSDRTAVEEALAEVRRRFGPIEIMVTSAAVTAFSPFVDISISDWDRMIAGQWGRIVTIASSAGQTIAVNGGALV